LAASLVMGLAIVVFDTLWQNAGLAGQGRLMTIIQIGTQVLLGAVVFISVAWLLRLEELRTMLLRLFRRPVVAEVAA
jgi:hypothetical protein